MSRWLARLSTSCFIIAAVLVWQGHKVATGQSSSATPPVVFYVSATLCIIAGVSGLHARHRRDPE
jgi:hypothetical protein